MTVKKNNANKGCFCKNSEKCQIFKGDPMDSDKPETVSFSCAPKKSENPFDDPEILDYFENKLSPHSDNSSLKKLIDKKIERYSKKSKKETMSRSEAGKLGAKARWDKERAKKEEELESKLKYPIFLRAHYVWGYFLLCYDAAEGCFNEIDRLEIEGWHDLFSNIDVIKVLKEFCLDNQKYSNFSTSLASNTISEWRKRILYRLHTASVDAQRKSSKKN